MLGVVILAPKMAPASTETSKNLRTLALETLKMAIPPIVLIVLVLGSILAGIVEPTQAAAVGVFGALILALFNGKLNWDLIKHTSKETAVFCGMVFMLTEQTSLARGIFKSQAIISFAGVKPLLLMFLCSKTYVLCPA